MTQGMMTHTQHAMTLETESPAASARAIEWIAGLGGAGDLDPDARFVPHGPPPGLGPSRHPIWKLPGMRPLAKPVRTAKGALEEWRTQRLASVISPSGMTFVHIPKNAGSSVAETLYGELMGHHSMQFFNAVLPKRLVEGGFSFAIIRNPRARLRSAFTYLKTMASTGPDLRFRDKYLTDIEDYPAFLARLEDESFRNNIMNWHHFREQCAFIADADGQILVDALFCMDRMDSVQALMNISFASARPIMHSNASGKAPKAEAQVPVAERILREDIRLFSALTASTAGVLRTPKFFERHQLPR